MVCFPCFLQHSSHVSAVALVRVESAFRLAQDAMCTGEEERRKGKENLTASLTPTTPPRIIVNGQPLKMDWVIVSLSPKTAWLPAGMVLGMLRKGDKVGDPIALVLDLAATSRGSARATCLTRLRRRSSLRSDFRTRSRERHSV